MSEDSRNALEAVHTDLLRALDLLNCGVLARDRDSLIRYANDRILQWLGYDEDELIGKPVSMLSVPELEQVLAEELKRTAAGDARARLTVLRRKDSTTFPVLIVPQLRHPGDEEQAYLSVIVDMGTVQTARSAGVGPEGGLRPRLERIALELQSMSLLADVPGADVAVMDHPALESLSNREREVVGHLVQGERVPAIAESLHISPHTVRNHLKSVYRQLGVGSQSELISFVKALKRPTVA